MSATKKPTVLIIRNAYNWQYGGAEQFTYNLANSLVGGGFNIVVSTHVPELLKKCHAKNIKTFKNLWLKNETHRRYAPLYYLLSPALVLQYMRVIQKNKVDLIIASSRDDQIFASIAAKLLHKPTIWIDHADMKGVVSSPFPFFRRAYFNAMRRTKKIVAVSQAEEAKIFTNLDKRFKEKFVVINNGAVVRNGQKIERPKDSFVIGFVGRVERDKGVFELVEAVRNIVSKNKNVYCWLAGKGEAQVKISGFIAQYKMSESVKLLGHLENVYDLLDSIDVFVYPSYHDASPLAPVEALLAGVPVIATKVGGIPEVINDRCGILIDPKNTQQLQVAIETLISDKALLEKLSRGARNEGKDYNFDTIVQNKYIPLIDSVL